jgi:hypothetical protein
MLPVCVLAICVSGVSCRTTGGPGADDLASIIVTNKSVDVIRRAVTAVFLQGNYQMGFSAPRELVFERQGSTMSTWVYGGWPGADTPLWERVRVTFMPLGEDTTVVGCNAYRVNNWGDGFFEEEKKVSKLGRSRYQKLLKKVEDRLAGAAAP